MKMPETKPKDGRCRFSNRVHRGETLTGLRSTADSDGSRLRMLVYRFSTGVGWSHNGLMLSDNKCFKRLGLDKQGGEGAF